VRRLDVALDLPRMRRLSVGMTAYAEELARRLPRVAPDLHFATFVRTSGLDVAEQVLLPLRVFAAQPRLVHHLSVYAPLAGARPFAITIHDVIHLRYPSHFKRSVGPYYRTVVRAVCARAARVITDDERTVEDLERFLGVSPRKVRVVPLGVDDAFLGPVCAATSPRPYVLYAGNRRPHKDLATLVRAWLRLPPWREVDLAFTGEPDESFGSRPPARQRGAVRFLGELSTADLARYYAGAAALVVPSLCEGFGLPMLEAAALGTPVVASAGAVPAVLRRHVRVFPTGDAAALGAALGDALDGHSDASAARTVARDLTWDRCAERTAEVYRDVLAEANAS